jgi:hypothetical protein
MSRVEQDDMVERNQKREKTNYERQQAHGSNGEKDVADDVMLMNVHVTAGHHQQ